MLPGEVEALIRESIDVYLKAQGYRPPRFGQRLLAQSFAGETIQPAKVAAVTAKEIDAVSTGLVVAIKNVIEKVRLDQYEGFQNDLLQLFDSPFDECADAIRKFGGDTFKRLRAANSAAGWFDQRLDDARQARHLDLTLLAAEALKRERHGIKSSQISDTTNSPRVSARIFISHSSTDRELAALLVDLLRSSLNLPAEAIRCTSVEGHRLAGGEETDRAIRKEIRECQAFIGLISATSIESAYVLFELGARWGAERHLLPLLAPTADAGILRGPLSGLNALSCSRAADLHQAVDEIAKVLGVSAEKPAAYQRHIEQILGWGAVKRSSSQEKISSPRSTGQSSKSPSTDYADAEAIIDKHCEQEWPDNYAMREFCIGEQAKALAELRAGRPEDIPEDVFHKIRNHAAQEWPTNFSMRLFTEQEEFKAYRKLQERRK